MYGFVRELCTYVCPMVDLRGVRGYLVFGEGSSPRLATTLRAMAIH